MKCLVVDDSAITRRILVNSLRRVGFDQIIEAMDGKQALNVCTPDVDVVITDWNMPNMAGVELVRSLRANAELAGIPVLLVTARNGKDDVVEAANAGVDGYVVKPFTPDTLKAKLEEIFQRRGANAAAAAAEAADAATAAATAAAKITPIAIATDTDASAATGG